MATGAGTDGTRTSMEHLAPGEAAGDELGTAGMAGLTVDGDQAIAALTSSVSAKLRDLQRQDAAIAIFNCDPSQQEAVVSTSQATWKAIGSQVQEFIDRLAVISYATRNLPVDGMGRSEAETHVRQVAERAQSPEALLSSLDLPAGAVGSRITERLQDVLAEISACGEQLKATFLESAAPWITGLATSEREPAISALRNEIGSRLIRSVPVGDLAVHSDPEHRFQAAMDPATGRVYTGQLCDLLTEISDPKSNYSDDGKAALIELCMAGICVGNAINSDQKSASLAETIVGIRLGAEPMDSAKATAIRLAAFNESFALAVDQFNAAHGETQIGTPLISRAQAEFSKCLDAASGAIVDGQAQAIRTALLPESRTKIPGTMTPIPAEQLEFLSGELESLLRQPTAIASETLAIELSKATERAPVAIEVTAAEEPEVAPVVTSSVETIELSGGVRVVADLPIDKPGSVLIEDPFTGRKAEFTVGGATEIDLVHSRLDSLVTELKAAGPAADPALLKRFLSELTAVADDEPTLTSGAVLTQSEFASAKGPKAGRLMQLRPAADSAESILLGTSAVAYRSERVDLTKAWNSMLVERDRTGVYLTLRTDEHRAMLKSPSVTAMNTVPAEIRVRLGDAALSRTEFDEKIGRITKDIEGIVLARGVVASTEGNGLGAGEFLTRVLKEGQVLKLSNITVAGRQIPQIRFADGAEISGVKLVDADMVFDGRIKTTAPVLVSGQSRIVFSNATGSSFTGFEVKASSTCEGDLSGSSFSGSKFHGEAAKELTLQGIRWERGEFKGGFNMAPRHATLVR